MVYLMFVPCGEVGWHDKLQHAEDGRTTRLVRLTHL
jgi:hypothetical protein